MGEASQYPRPHEFLQKTPGRDVCPFLEKLMRKSARLKSGLQVAGQGNRANGSIGVRGIGVQAAVAG